ncbi:MAG TPA: sugar ABC transporter permease [Caldilineae bacterium]|nr:sugar ABC transporter permease [Caldilineae bacterium]
MAITESARGPAQPEPGLESAVAVSRVRRLGARLERMASASFLMPSVLVILFLSIFPLIVSLYLSLTRLQFIKGGFKLSFVGLANYRKLFVGSEKTHFMGVLVDPSPLGWGIFGAVVLWLAYMLVRYARGGNASVMGFFWRLVASVITGAGVWLLVRSLSPGGRPGTLVVTLIYVFGGVTIQYLLGLVLALLCIQQIPGRRFFRVVFLLPMMITPVGIAYMFRMLTDFTKGPFTPIWRAFGLAETSWVNNPWTARAAVMIGDIWQWTPFMFIVLLAALESQPIEPIEAALVDGASRWQIFRHITIPTILPVSTTLILIRLIEAFKIIDLPNVLTNGGPGTATESLTLQAFMTWRTLDVGGSAAVAYLLLLVVTFVALVTVNIIRRRVLEVL